MREFEDELYEFMLGGSTTSESFGVRFDAFADFLRNRKLSCKWPFLAYLSFLLQPTQYFPVLPGRFEKLLNFYGINFKFSGKVEWKRYSFLLDVAELLKEKLSIYGQINTIHVQSYMWVVSGLLEKAFENTYYTKKFDISKELRSRQNRVAEQKRIGLMGEHFILDCERKKLIEAGREDLANLVSLVAAESASIGYDILSFKIDGNPIHIEVKTTTRDKKYDSGFWLSETERDSAESDPNWKIFRVWEIDSSPSYEDLGNIVTNNQEWKVDPSSWFVSRIHQNT